jgi:hypothetical protein
VVRSPLAGAHVATGLNELSAATGPATSLTNPAARAFGPAAGGGGPIRNRAAGHSRLVTGFHMTGYFCKHFTEGPYPPSERISVTIPPD